MAGSTLKHHAVTTLGMLLLLYVLFSSHSHANEPAEWQQLGQPVQYVFSKTTSVSAGQLVLADGTSWHSSQPGFGLSATPVLVFSANQLRTGAAELWLHGFKLSARFSDGELTPLNGRLIQVQQIEHQGSRLILPEQQRLLVTDKDRRFSRHWQGNFNAILTEDWQLIHVPSLQMVSVIPLAH